MKQGHGMYASWIWYGHGTVVEGNENIMGEASTTSFE